MEKLTAMKATNETIETRNESVQNSCNASFAPSTVSTMTEQQQHIFVDEVCFRLVQFDACALSLSLPLSFAHTLTRSVCQSVSLNHPLDVLRLPTLTHSIPLHEKKMAKLLHNFSRVTGWPAVQQFHRQTLFLFIIFIDFIIALVLVLFLSHDPGGNVGKLLQNIVGVARFDFTSCSLSLASTHGQRGKF